jgi:hypothetical protein
MASPRSLHTYINIDVLDCIQGHGDISTAATLRPIHRQSANHFASVLFRSIELRDTKVKRRIDALEVDVPGVRPWIQDLNVVFVEEEHPQGTYIPCFLLAISIDASFPPRGPGNS